MANFQETLLAKSSDTDSERSASMILDWIFSPYKSSGWVVREVANTYDLTLKEWNLSEIRDAQLVMLPRHISSVVKDIRRNSEYAHVDGAEPFFFIDGEPIGTHNAYDTLASEVEKRGIHKIRNPEIPETFVHPRLNVNRQDTSVMVKAITTRDIAGQGLPSPCRHLEARFGSLGSPEVLSFLSDTTRQYGRIMSAAFIGSEVAGYITHLPKPVAWRIGCSHVTNVKDMRVLQIIDLYVYPKFLTRKDVKRVLLERTKQFAKKTRLVKIEVFATEIEPGNPDTAPSTGCKTAYLDTGFVKRKEVILPDSSGDNTENGLGITQMMYRI